jgi:hypothetical protein
MGLQENGLKGHQRLAQGTTGEKREPKASAARDALGRESPYEGQLADLAREDLPRQIGKSESVVPDDPGRRSREDAR